MKNKIIIFLVLASFSGFGQITRTLPNVTNTADSMKPVSTVQKAVIVQKLHTVTTISALQGFTDATIAQFDGSTWNKVSGNVASDGGAYAGTIINVNTSFYWQRRFQIPDAAFFGVIADNSTDNTTTFQNYINYCLANNYEVLLPRGTVRYNSPIVISAPNGMTIRGKGTSQSQLYFNSTTVGLSGIKITGAYNKSYAFSDFSVIKEDNPANMKGIGLELVNLQNMILKNVFIFRYDIGIKLYDTNISSFENLKINYCNTGLLGASGTNSPPNLLKFTNCSFFSNIIKGATFANLHSVYFDNCTFEDNGTQSLANSGAFDCTFTSLNGLNSVNFNSCYFEHSGGDYDIKIQNNSAGTSNISNCTFNRIDNAKFSIYNIYLVSDPTSTAQFVNSLNLSGNGFFVANTYVPDYGRPTVKFNANAVFKGFNIIENNNVFGSTVDAFVIPTTYKQETNGTKLLASARTTAAGGLAYGYNIASVAKQGTGNYLITFTNPLPKNPVISALPVGAAGIAYIGGEAQASIVVLTTNLAGAATDYALSIIVY